MTGITFRNSLKPLFLGALTVFMFSCKSTKIATDGAIDDRLTSKAVIKAHYQNQIGFNTLSGKVKIDYSDGESSQGFGINLRIEKDKAIWMSSTPLPLVKAYITPDRVSFYNKLQDEYFDGDFSYLSDLLGVEVDFNIVQNLLTGQALLDMRNEKYMVSTSEDAYILQPKNAGTLFKTLFKVEPKNFRMALQQLSQPLKKRLLAIDYKNYQKVNGEILPNEINVLVVEEDNQSTITLEYRNMELNRPLNFPYKIPKGFKEVVLE